MRQNKKDEKEEYGYGYHDERHEHLKNKRMTNAIRSKNIDELMWLDEDDEEYDY